MDPLNTSSSTNTLNISTNNNLNNSNPNAVKKTESNGLIPVLNDLSDTEINKILESMDNDLKKIEYLKRQIQSLENAKQVAAQVKSEKEREKEREKEKEKERKRHRENNIIDY